MLLRSKWGDRRRRKLGKLKHKLKKMNKKAQSSTNLVFGLSVIIFVALGGLLWGLGIIYSIDKLGLFGEILIGAVGLAGLIIELIKRLL